MQSPKSIYPIERLQKAVTLYNKAHRELREASQYFVKISIWEWSSSALLQLAGKILTNQSKEKESK